MAFPQRLVNGGGFIDREYGVGRGSIDLLVRFLPPNQAMQLTGDSRPLRVARMLGGPTLWPPWWYPCATTSTIDTEPPPLSKRGGGRVVDARAFALRSNQLRAGVDVFYVHLTSYIGSRWNAGADLRQN